MDTLILFSKKLNQRSLTPTWPLTSCLLRSHVWLYPRIIVSKSHDNTSMYVDTVIINFANYHIHTHTYYIHTYYIHTMYRMSDHIVSYWTQFRRDKKYSDILSLFQSAYARWFELTKINLRSFHQNDIWESCRFSPILFSKQTVRLHSG